MQKNIGPAPLTLECDGQAAPVWLPKISGHFGVRIPAKDNLLDLITKTGPLVSTSANLGGEPPAQSLEAAQTIFGEKLDFYVDEGEIVGKPSTLVRNNNGRLEVLRAGAVKIDGKEQ